MDDVINKMGLSDEELDGLTSEMMEALGNARLMDIENSDSDTDDEGKTATFPFLNRLFGNMGGQKPENSAPGGELTPAQSGPEHGRPVPAGPQQAPPRPKKKFLDNYCINLTDRRARQAGRMIAARRSWSASSRS